MVEIITVTNCGAIGDGVYDCSDAFDEALKKGGYNYNTPRQIYAKPNIACAVE